MRVLGSLTILAATVFLVAGCAPVLSPGAQRLIESDGRELERCRFLGTIEESETSGLLFIESGLRVARTRALNRIASAGGTHYVWGQPRTGIRQAVSAFVYRCPGPGLRV